MKIQQRNPRPFTFRGGDKGVLLIHGFTGTTAELRPMGTDLHQRGYTVHAPLLKGHGTTPEEMAETSWHDWWNSVLQGYEELRNIGCDEIFAAGLSMGGVLALNLAYEQERKKSALSGLISMCSPVFVRDRRIHLTRFLQYVKRYKANRGKKEPHIEKHLYSYDRTPLRCVTQLQHLIRHVRRRIPHIQTPVMVVQAEKDETVEPRSAEYIYSHIGSKQKEYKGYANSSHIITLDRERNRLFEDVDQFMRSVLGNRN